MSKVLDQIVQESNISTVDGRPTLLSIHRKTFKYLYDSIAAVQETVRPTASIYGIKYFYDAGESTDLEVHKNGPFGGRFSFSDLSSILDYDQATTYNTGDVFKNRNQVYEVLVDGYTGPALAGDESDPVLLFDEILANNIRLVTDAALTEKVSDRDFTPQEVDFLISSWRSDVRTRKIMSKLTQEALDDIESNHINAKELVEEVFATVIAEEINRDLIAKLITVSKRGSEVDLTGLDYYNGARKLLAEIQRSAQEVYTDSTFNCTFVVMSAKAAGYIQSLDGVVTKEENGETKFIIESSNMELIVDKYAVTDYFVVGAKHEIGELDLVAPIYFSPYNPGGNSGMNTIQMATYDPKSLQPSAIITSRYAITASPFAGSSNTADVIDGEDWAALSGKADLSKIRKIAI